MHSTEPLLSSVGECLDVRLLRHVGADAQDIGTSGPQLVDGPVQGLDLNVRDDDVGAFATEVMRER